jgi:hypothetical protein
MMGLVAKDWTSTPGSTIGGGGQWSKSKWLGAYQGFLGGSSGSQPSESNPMPVRVMNPGTGEFAAANYATYMAQSGGTNDPNLMTKAFKWANQQTRVEYDEQGNAYNMPAGAAQKDKWIQLDEADAAIADVARDMGLLTTVATQETTATSIQMRATKDLIPIQMRSAEEIGSLADQMSDLWKSAIVAEGGLSRVMGTLQSVAGQIPSQEVGKKRSLFSKILGIAAPFLSFIPGVGPILSTIAGAAGSAIGGNYGAAVSSIAGGFQAGGVFRSSGVKSLPGKAGRAMGGPVYAGTPYVVGEHRPELFVPNQNGWIHPSVGGGNPGLGEAVDRLHALLNRLESMPAHEVVRIGARGMIGAMDSDAELITLHGRRLGMT